MQNYNLTDSLTWTRKQRLVKKTFLFSFELRHDRELNNLPAKGALDVVTVELVEQARSELGP